jgi:hypothetical protein
MPRERPIPWRSNIAPIHHAVIGRLTLRDWLAFVAHHEARHAAQIDEIAAAFQQ